MRSPTSATRPSCTPTARCCQAVAARVPAWNFHLLREPKPLSTVTYYMNHLQRLHAERDYCVTLNRTEAIDPEQVIRTISYSHPVYTPAGVAAQAEAREHQRLSPAARTTAAPTGAGAFTRTACSARCARVRRSG